MEEQQQIREQIAAHVAEYLKSGGKIEILPPFNDPTPDRKLPVRNIREGAKNEN